MPSRRMITSEMWVDDVFTSLTMFERLLWIGLITGCADDQGRLQDNSVLIRSKVFPLDDIPIKQIEDGLNKFASATKIARYTAGNKRLIQIVQWWKHQTPRWAGKSNYPAPPGWIDRERYHGPGNEILESNWSNKGGYIDNYSAPCTMRDGDVKGDVKGDGEEEKSTPSTPFEIIQHQIEKITGLPPNGGSPAAINEILDMKATQDDIQAGYSWLCDQKKQFRYYSQLVGPTRTAMSIRLQAGHASSGSSQPVHERQTEEEIAKLASQFGETTGHKFKRLKKEGIIPENMTFEAWYVSSKKEATP